MRFPALPALSLPVALLCAPSLLAQDVDYERFTLDNGLAVIFHEDHSVPEVCVNLWYHVGSKDERAGRSGFAHLFEHLMFMGTKRVPGAEFDLLMEARGGQNNASTSEDRTNYYATGPAELLPTLLWLEADRMEALGQAMTQAKLDKQRDVVRNERRQSYENAPYGRASLRVYEEMFPVGHPYHLPVIGSHADLEAATVEDVQRFFATYYVPINASLVVAGDFDPDLTKPLVERLFGSIARGADPRHAEAQAAALQATRRVTMTDQVQFARTSLVYHSPPFMQAGDAEMDLIADVLTDGVSSRLYQRLVVEHQLASAVSAYQESMALGSLFRIQATARPGVELAEIEREIDAVISELVRRGPSKRELRQKQAQLEYRALARLQSLQAKADQLNAYHFHRGEPDSFRWDLDRYRDATPAAVRRWAARVLRPEARLVLNVLPATPIAGANPRDRKPAVSAAEPFSPPSPETFKLGNGVTVHHWSRRELPLVKVRLLLPSGAASDPAGQGGLAALTAEMLDEGTGKLDAAGVAEALELLGASVQSGCDQETTEVDLSTLRRNLEPALGILADVVQRPRLDPDEWTRVQRVHIERLRRAQDHPSYLAYTVALRRFFGDAHPYSRPSDGTPTSVATVALEDIRRFHAQLYQPARATLLIAGDLSAEEARRLLDKSFGGWEAASTTPELATPGFPASTGSRPQLLIVHRPGAVQTVIQFLMPAPSYQDPRRTKLELVNTILGGSFTSRLNQNLRERNGYTYGARSNLALEPSAGYFSASSSVHTEVTGAALREFLNQLGRMKRESITAEETRKAKALQRMDVVQTFSGLGGVLWAGSVLVRNQRPFSELGEELRAIEQVEERELNQVAATVAPLDQSVLVLVGDKAKILPQLKGLRLPRAVEVDASGAVVRQP